VPVSTAALFEFVFFETLPIQIEASDAPLTSNAGLLPLRQFDERISLTSQFAAVLDDPRDPNLIEHTLPEMVRSRIFGILVGYEDRNDHDTLRTDSGFKLIADRAPEDDALASQPTLSRFENQIKRFPAEVVLLPCQVVRAGGRLLYRLLRWNPWVNVQCLAVEVLRQLRFP
jgi:Transposase DDE domain group 1